MTTNKSVTELLRGMADLIEKLQASESLQDRMAIQYGEVVTKKAAAKILSCSAEHINDMIRDGRLESACEGERVSVRSIARYIEAPAKAEEEHRRKKAAKKYDIEFSV